MVTAGRISVDGEVGGSGFDVYVYDTWFRFVSVFMSMMIPIVPL